MELRTKKAFFGASLLSLVILAIFFFKHLSGQEELARGFPILSPGAYVGEIHSTGREHKTETIYCERLREGDTLLLILFREEFQPQTLFPERLARKNIYKPLVIQDQKGVFRLSGVEEEGNYHGIVKVDSEVVGTWMLRKMDAKELGKNTVAENSAELSGWMQAKERARIAKEKLDEITEKVSDSEKRIKTMEESLSDEAGLRRQAEGRKAELEKLLQKLRADRDVSGKNVESLASELDLLLRITKRGQTVSLERRIVQRENRWYEVNWQSEEELGMEELPTEEAGIDLGKLEEAVRRARETKSLLREREDELKKIRSLEHREIPGAKSGTPSPDVQPSSPTRTQEPPKEERPPGNLWDRLFG